MMKSEVQPEYSASELAIVSAVNGANFEQRAYDLFDKLQFSHPVNYSHARFIWAAENRNVEALTLQLQTSIPDSIKTLALHQTISSWKYECCQLLLDNGADHDGIDIDGYTPLTHAAYKFESEVAGLLHSYGADLELANLWGQRPLHVACASQYDHTSDDFAQRRLNMVALLMGRGADANAVDDEGSTPLHFAVASAKNIELVRLLLQHGADNINDNSGFTPLQLAEKHCLAELAELLRQHVTL